MVRTLPGVAKRLFVGMSVSQLRLLRLYGRVEPPLGRRGAYYWPLKTTAAAATASVIEALPAVPPSQLVVLPVSLTFIGLRDLLGGGELYACDSEQYRLYSSLQVPSPADAGTMSCIRRGRRWGTEGAEGKVWRLSPCELRWLSPRNRGPWLHSWCFVER